MIPTFGGDNDILYSCHLGRWYLYSWEILIFSRWWIYGACCLAMIAYHKFFFLLPCVFLSCYHVVVDTSTRRFLCPFYLKIMWESLASDRQCTLLNN